MDEDRLNIQVTEKTVASRSQNGRGDSLWLILGGLVLLLLLGGGIFLFWPREYATPSAVVQQAVQSKTQVADVATTDPIEQIVDDGETLWASPTHGEAIDCRYLLPGTQLILHLRVADLLAHAEGEKALAALGPWGQHIIRQITNSTGIEFEELESLLLGIRPARDGSLDFALRLRANQPFASEKINPGCFIPNQDENQIVVWCATNTIQELKKQANEPPLFSRELQRILQQTDSSRIATLAFAGKFLQISGDKLLPGAGKPLQKALVDFLGDEATATAVSAHWDENFFLELRSTVVLNERPHRFAALLEQRIAESSDRVEDAVLSRPLHPYGRKVLARFPAMLRKLSNYTRSGEDEDLSVLRSYLPVNAGHNLVMAAELLLNMPTNRGVVAAADVPVARKSIAERLRQTTSLVFPKETLQRSLEMLSEDLDILIKIAGRDLQLEGITKNQSFAIDLRERPAAEILLAVLLRANPDRTASGPTDSKQKLVYVIRDQAGAIVVTTRAAAGRRGEKLPIVFQPAAR